MIGGVSYSTAANPFDPAHAGRLGATFAPLLGESSLPMSITSAPKVAKKKARTPAKSKPCPRRPSAAEPDFKAFLAHAMAAPLLPCEALDPLRRSQPDRFLTVVARAITGGWNVEGAQVESFSPPIDWTYKGRSNQYFLHSWAPVSSLLVAHGFSPQPEYLEMAFAYAGDWIRQFQFPAFARPAAAVLRPDRDDEAFAWAGTALGLRAQRLGYLLDVLAHDPASNPAVLADFYDALRYHAEALSTPSAFSARSKHGLYQALGLMALCRRFNWHPPFAALRAGAERMLEAALEHQFLADGGHAEHSPGQHFTALFTLLGAREAGLIAKTGQVARLLERAEAAAAWMLAPDGRMAPLGDTDFQKTASFGQGDRFSDQTLIYGVSGGLAGAPPVSGVAAFAETGYAFARIHAGNPAHASYLAQMGSFHSRHHKHADHLTFAWSEGPVAILTDPGRFGYDSSTRPGSELHNLGFWYSNPRRVYVESTHAHNCVEIDGESHARAGLVPFGSAFRQADVQDDLVVFDFELGHAKAVRQIRTLIFAPNEFLLVVDWLQSDVEDSHDFRQWFKLAPEWTATALDDLAVAASRDNRTLWSVDLLGAGVSPVWRGASDPLRGWVSPRGGEFLPAPSFHFQRLATPQAAFATLFLLDGWAEPDAATRVESFGEAAVFAFRTRDRIVEINYQRDNGVTVKRSTRRAT